MQLQLRVVRLKEVEICFKNGDIVLTLNEKDWHKTEIKIPALDYDKFEEAVVERWLETRNNT